MAVDKLVDSAQLDSDLTSVANAIRTKGGTSAQLAFPADFVSAVNAIPSGIGTLLATKSLGSISTSDTAATDTGQTITVTGASSYDLLIVEISVDTKTNGRHASTTRLIWLYNTSNISSRTSATIATATQNIKLNSSGTASSRVNTTPYGIYAYSCSISNNNATIAVYRRYNSTQTGTINGNYTARVYGVKTYDLIGG